MKNEYLCTYHTMPVSSQQEILYSLVRKASRGTDHIPLFCPDCHSSRLIRKGIQNGKQRYQCRSCNKKFTADTGYFTSHLRITKQEFLIISFDTLNRVPMRITAEKINRSVHCVHKNRQKFLAILPEIMEE